MTATDTTIRSAMAARVVAALLAKAAAMPRNNGAEIEAADHMLKMAALHGAKI